jgi:hypothetical protein
VFEYGDLNAAASMRVSCESIPQTLRCLQTSAAVLLDAELAAAVGEADELKHKHSNASEAFAEAEHENERAVDSTEEQV